MEKIKIPSPSAILESFPTVSSSKARKAPVSTQNAAPTQTATAAPTNKPKQSKSRNGCITCKAKRLKCDETKPTCLQCKKRNVECGGYKKDFKWRPFGETEIASKSSSQKGKKAALFPPTRKPNLQIPEGRGNKSLVMKGSLLSQSNSANTHKSSLRRDIPSTYSDQSDLVEKNLTISVDELFGHQTFRGLGRDPLTSSLSLVMPSDQSPGLSNILLSPLDDQEQFTLKQTMHERVQKQNDFSFKALLEGDGEEVEEIVRRSDCCTESEILDFAKLTANQHIEQTNESPSLLKEPVFSVASPEMLILHFDRSTCGILSVKDGANENPWRTLVWPLAKDTPALYHAIFSLAAFHSSKENPALRVHGVDHMRQSITYMVQDIQNMRTDAALATSLALAFADTWDQNTRTCIQHLRGAKALVCQVVGLGRQGGMYGNELSRVRFLYNTWLYMDVIARLTSFEEHGDMNAPFLPLHDGDLHEIDPLMGCAATLFPLINQVARLIQRVRKTDTNSISLISQAIELKRLVEQWEPPDWFEPPEDPTSEVQHSIQTAHAYRWATLLYLHQAVPEMPSEPASELANRVLVLLATVPPSSRTTIIQMFPLLAAGCEAEEEEDRNWVLNRWRTIQSRLMLGSIDRCVDVVREVWIRRDNTESEQQQQKRLQSSARGGNTVGHSLSKEKPFYRGRGLMGGLRRSSTMSSLENIEFERTVRGRLHWVSVMQEWGWEGKSLHINLAPLAISTYSIFLDTSSLL